ncbi:Uncharacterized protein FWK35_00019869, partial [Aphis craccivora]
MFCVRVCVCVCVYEYSITSRNNTSISNFGGEVLSKHFPIVFNKIERNKKKIKIRKTGIFTQNQFSTKSIFI